MDSSAAPPQQPPHLQRHPQQQQHHHPQNYMVGAPPQSQHVQPQGSAPSQHPNSYSFQSHPVTSNNLMTHHQHQQHQQQGNRFPFDSMATSAGPHQNKIPMDYSDAGVGDTSSPPTGGVPGFIIESAKKKRGRPRKYSPDGAGSSIALGLSPTPTPLATTMDSGGGGADTLSSENPGKKHRGRPSGSGKKQFDALGTPGVGFTPHVITVNAGEDIASKILAFSQQGPRTVCILSANGAICNVTLRQPATSGGTVTYEGRYEIISLSGSLVADNSGYGGLSVSLAGTGGKVLGGRVVGTLIAAAAVQIIVGSFIQDGKKQKLMPAIAPAPNMLSFGNNNNNSNNAGGMEGSPPPSQGGSSGGGGGGGGGSSDDENGSPINEGSYVNNNNNNASGGQSMPMYTNMGWANSSMKMHHHHHPN